MEQGLLDYHLLNNANHCSLMWKPRVHYAVTMASSLADVNAVIAMASDGCSRECLMQQPTWSIKWLMMYGHKLLLGFLLHLHTISTMDKQG